MTRDYRGVLALFCLMAIFGYAFVLLFLNRQATDIPTWMAALASLVVGHYFGAKNEVTRRDEVRDLARDASLNAEQPTSTPATQPLSPATPSPPTA